MSKHESREGWGPFVGILIFLLGVGLLLLTFSLAYGMFTTPPEVALGLAPGKTLNVNDASRSGIAMLYRVLMLLVMCIVSSLVASRGIRLYGAMRRPLEKVEILEEEPSPKA